MRPKQATILIFAQNEGKSQQGWLFTDFITELFDYEAITKVQILEVRNFLSTAVIFDMSQITLTMKLYLIMRARSNSNY